ncbi:MAG: DUF1573 domain-containing protein [Ginsengibacter sp.]
MRKIFTILCTIIISTFSQAQTPAKSNAPLTLSAEKPVLPDNEAIALKEKEFNFGKIPQGKPVTHIFAFTNTGTTPLKLDNVQASCGCTTPEWSKEVVAPGATSKITVGYNAANDGDFTKTITITYNGAQTSILTIKGEVWKTPVASAPENSAISSLKNQL